MLGGMVRALLFVLLLPAAARADATAVASDAVDVAAVKSKLKLVSDGKGHYVALVPFEISDEFMFWGDGKTFWQLRTYGGGAEGTKSFDRVFWEPRVVQGYKAQFAFRDGKYQVQCDKRVTELKPVAEAESASLLDKARFVRPRWNHRAYALARDDQGNYFYVDKVREPEELKSFRLYAGPKGRMKLQKMINVVSDSEGDIFATRTGELRLVLGRSESFWVHGKSKQKLTLVPVEDNHVMIYTDLGVYTGEPLGTPCDDL
jgi:hypothetical protein